MKPYVQASLVLSVAFAIGIWLVVTDESESVDSVTVAQASGPLIVKASTESAQRYDDDVRRFSGARVDKPDRRIGEQVSEQDRCHRRMFARRPLRRAVKWVLFWRWRRC